MLDVASSATFQQVDVWLSKTPRKLRAALSVLSSTYFLRTPLHDCLRFEYLVLPIFFVVSRRSSTFHVLNMRLLQSVHLRSSSRADCTTSCTLD